MKKLSLFAGIPLMMLASVNALEGINQIDMSGTIVRLISYLLGVCGAAYLAAGLWSRAEKGSQSWKYLSVSMILFVFWNIIGTFSILLDVLTIRKSTSGIMISDEALNTYIVIVKILDPVIAVIVFLILLFGLRKIIDAMRTKPWTVFSKEDDEEEKSNE
jgi:heme/copper-type cytochrome/quinol oxidase subunit 2